MYTLMKKAVMAGLGVRVMVNHVVDDLVKKGESAPDKPAAKVREVVEACEQSAHKVETAVKEGVCLVAQAVRMPTRAEVDALERKIEELSRKVDALSRNTRTPS
jgi:polyhydroxyalkanoate synthesis regulator phasin